MQGQSLVFQLYDNNHNEGGKFYGETELVTYSCASTNHVILLCNRGSVCVMFLPNCRVSLGVMEGTQYDQVLRLGYEVRGVRRPASRDAITSSSQGSEINTTRTHTYREMKKKRENH